MQTIGPFSLEIPADFKVQNESSQISRLPACLVLARGLGQTEWQAPGDVIPFYESKAPARADLFPTQLTIMVQEVQADFNPQQTLNQTMKTLRNHFSGLTSNPMPQPEHPARRQAYGRCTFNGGLPLEYLFLAWVDNQQSDRPLHFQLQATASAPQALRTWDAMHSLARELQFDTHQLDTGHTCS